MRFGVISNHFVCVQAGPRVPSLMDWYRDHEVLAEGVYEGIGLVQVLGPKPPGDF